MKPHSHKFDTQKQGVLISFTTTHIKNMETEKLEAIVLIQALYENHPNSTSIFDAYGLANLKYFKVFKEHGISFEEYGRSIEILNEAYDYLCSKEQPQ